MVYMLSEFNVVDSFDQGCALVCQSRTLMTHLSSFVWMPVLLPPMTHAGTGGNWTQAMLGTSPTT